jgi:hypothetical protein
MAHGRVDLADGFCSQSLEAVSWSWVGILPLSSLYAPELNVFKFMSTLCWKVKCTEKRCNCIPHFISVSNSEHISSSVLGRADWTNASDFVCCKCRDLVIRRGLWLKRRVDTWEGSKNCLSCCSGTSLPWLLLQFYHSYEEMQQESAQQRTARRILL